MSLRSVSHRRRTLAVPLPVLSPCIPSPYITSRQACTVTSPHSLYHTPLVTASAVVMVEGEQLNITRVSRLHMGAYLCIARNGILPTVSKRIDVKVHCE